MAGLFTACEKSPTGPTHGPPVTAAAPNSAPQGQPVIRSIEIEGPQVVPLGATVEFRLIAQMADGSRRDITTDARWSGEDGTIASLSNPGRVTGVRPGEIRVRAEFETYERWKEVMVLPAGTHRLEGQVNDGNVPVEGARIEITRGVGAGLSTLTDFFGLYRVYGVSGETRFRVTKDGYQPAVPTVVVSDHQRYDVWLTLSQPRLELSGNYTLTITAADHCGVGVGEGHVPQQARIRTYQATLRQDGSQLEVALSRETFNVPGRAMPDFSGRVVPGGIELSIPEYEPGPYVERLPSGGFLVVWGRVAAAGTANRLAGRLDGEFRIFETENVWSLPSAWCSSPNHQFLLSR